MSEKPATPAKLNLTEMEARWYSHWENMDYFKSVPDDREPFTVLIPPPNVTGVLHMGHMLNNTIQDILIRKARLDGKNACWVPGTDHASIATEAKVVHWLRDEKGLKKSDLTREEFMAYAFVWKEKYGGIILQQLRRLGASCDWSRTAFTMDPGYYRDVVNTFVDLHSKGKLYRGKRMVNWDPVAKTVLSNEEVLYGEEKSGMFKIHYKQPDGSDGIVVATVRPETIFGDAAVAVNSKDARYKHLVGKMVCIPLINKEIPVIADDYVEADFGTGVLKVTPAHDINDYEIGLRHNLTFFDILAEDGTLNELCAYAPAIGRDRFDVRNDMKKWLTESGNFVEIEAYQNKVGRSERTQAVVEPRLSLQWFVSMEDLKGPAVEAVLKDKTIRFYPDNFRNMYRSWMDGLRDWCISRQLWWGQRVPAWYLVSEGIGQETQSFVAVNAAEALEKARIQTGRKDLKMSDLRQDEDVLDTWASSWLWPISVFDGFDKPDGEVNYYYPSSVLVTGWDIIFFWVARMIMAGYEYRGQEPFKAVYFTGMVRDSQRRKMSKSLGNSPDALLLIDTYGADGVRFGLMSSSPAGGDLLFDEKLCESGRNFSNKIWNAANGAVLGWPVTDKKPTAETAALNSLAIKWIEGRLKATITEVNKSLKQFRLSEAIQSLYQFIWDDLFSWFLEMVKPAYGEPIDRKSYDATIGVFSQAMVALHPFMPFITEEVWHSLLGDNAGDCCAQVYPKGGKVNKATEASLGAAIHAIQAIRELRNKELLKPKDMLRVSMQQTSSAEAFIATKGWSALVCKLGFLESLELTTEAPQNAKSVVAGTEKYYVVLNKTVDVVAERTKLTQELTQQQGFLKSVMGKLGNERFVASAPAAVVEGERKKAADAEARIALLEASLASL
jgi:valyl-tRNA synthetase